MSKPRFLLFLAAIIAVVALASTALLLLPNVKEPGRSPTSESGEVGNATKQQAQAKGQLVNHGYRGKTGAAQQLTPVTPEIIEHGPRDVRRVALTFDLCEAERDHAGFDQAIVTILEQKHVKATFFMGGKWAESHPEAAKTLSANGLFEIANHSYSHKLFDKISDIEAKEQVVKAQASIANITGVTPRYFRFPAGRYTPETLRLVADCGLKAIQWDVVTGDPDPDVKAVNMIRVVKQKARGGSIIIMHANGRGRHTAEALPEIIETLQKSGYELVTISELVHS